jgi:hypothetical protein
MSGFGLRLLAAGSVTAMPRKRHAREGLTGLAIVLLICALGWGVLVWLNLR